MKDTRPSRKTSKAQENIREYLSDIARGCATHFAGSTVRSWEGRYKDFEKSRRQAWKDYKSLFAAVPTVNEPARIADEQLIFSMEQLKKIINEAGTVTVNEVEPPVMQDVVVMERCGDVLVVNPEQAEIINKWERTTNYVRLGIATISSVMGAMVQYLYMVAR